MANCPNGKLPLLNGTCCGFGEQPNATGSECVSWVNTDFNTNLLDNLNTDFNTNLLDNLNTDLGESSNTNNQSNATGKNNAAWMQFLNPAAITGLTGGIADIIAAKNPAPVNITNIEAPPEQQKSTNNTAMIGGVVGLIVVIMVVIVLMKRKKVG